MAKIKKWLPAMVIISSVLLAGIVFGQATFADVDANRVEKTAKLKKLLEQERIESAKAEQMPAQTLEEIEKKLEQAKKAKKIAHEIGKLKEELDPQGQREHFEENLLSVKGIMHSNKYYATMVNDPVHGEKYKKAYDILIQKFKTLDRIEKDYNEGTKSVEQLQKELDDLVNIKELQIGN